MKTMQNIVSLIAEARGSANAFLKRELEKCALSDLAPTHGNILFALLRRGPVSMGELARQIRRDKSTVTALVKKLEALGYVRRDVADADSRSSMVSLTRKGEALREPFLAISERLFAVATRGIPEAELKALGATLTKVIDNFSRTEG